MNRPRTESPGYYHALQDKDFLGAVLEDADASERASVLTAMPVPARLIWQTIGRVSYARHTRRERGRPSSLAASAV